MSISRFVSCDERDKTMFVKRKEAMSELESARLSHSVASKQPARPQDNIRAQRNSPISSADSRSVRNGPLVALDKRHRVCRRVGLRLDGPTQDEALHRRLGRVD